MNQIYNNKTCSLIKNNNLIKCISLLRICGINTSASICAEKGKTKNVAHVYKHWTKQFIKAGISEPRQSIQFILTHIFNLQKVSDLFRKFTDEVDIETLNRIEILCKKRLSKMPVQYILGEWQFRELILKMQPPVFIPRPETEMLIDFILDEIKELKRKINILEICCGSGAISLSLLKNNSYIEMTAIDKSEEACSLSLQNAISHKLNNRMTIIKYEINEKNRLQFIENKFDLIVSNPPYVPTENVRSVQPEIRLYEDLDALDGGFDGLNIIKSILLLSKTKLLKGGKLFLETDPSHPTKISQIIENRPELGLKFVKSYKDFCSKERFVQIEKI